MQCAVCARSVRSHPLSTLRSALSSARLPAQEAPRTGEWRAEACSRDCLPVVLDVLRSARVTLTVRLVTSAFLIRLGALLLVCASHPHESDLLLRAWRTQIHFSTKLAGTIEISCSTDTSKRTAAHMLIQSVLSLVFPLPVAPSAAAAPSQVLKSCRPVQVKIQWSRNISTHTMSQYFFFSPLVGKIAFLRLSVAFPLPLHMHEATLGFFERFLTR